MTQKEAKRAFCEMCHSQCRVLVHTRLGVLLPSLSVVIEPEFAKMTPEGVVCHFQRFPFKGGRAGLAPGEVVEASRVIEELRGLGALAVEAAEVIFDVKPSVVAMCCTGGSFVGGGGYDRMLIQRIQQRIGNIPTTTASTAALDALSALGVRRISLATPYPKELAKLQEKFLEDNGVEVLHTTWISKRTTLASELPPEAVYSLVEEANESESEAIFLSCANLYTIELIEKLEEDLKKPVITSIQATMWRLLRLANINDEIEGYGQLFHKGVGLCEHKNTGIICSK